MKTNIKKIGYAISAAILGVPFLASAQGGFQPTNTNYAKGTTTNTIGQIVQNVISYVMAGLAALAIIGIIVSGIMYITSGGDEDRVKSAKNWLLYSIVGLVVAVVSYAIVAAVGGIFTTTTNTTF